MKVKVPPVGILVHYRSYAGDRLGDAHNEGDPILSLVIGVGDPSNPTVTVRCFPNGDTVPIRRDAAIVLTPGPSSRHCVSPLPGTEGSWNEVEIADGLPSLPDPAQPVAVDAPAPAKVIQRAPAPPPAEGQQTAEQVLEGLK